MSTAVLRLSGAGRALFGTVWGGYPIVNRVRGANYSWSQLSRDRRANYSWSHKPLRVSPTRGLPGESLQVFEATPWGYFILLSSSQSLLVGPLYQRRGGALFSSMSDCKTGLSLICVQLVHFRIDPLPKPSEWVWPVCPKSLCITASSARTTKTTIFATHHPRILQFDPRGESY